MTTRIAAVLTCHNRRAQTLACLAALRAQTDIDAVIDLYVVDDGSSDGTGEAVAEAFPDAQLLRGDGSLYWNRGMHRGLTAADDSGKSYDYFLWVNDDTTLDDSAVSVLLAAEQEVCRQLSQPAIVVGSTRDPVSGALTYGGRERAPGVRRTRFVQVQPGDVPKQSETMNGNVVLVPRAVVARIGHIDPTYRHKWGDEDYGLRARAAGFTVWIAAGTIGTCGRNREPIWGERHWRDELRELAGIKGFHPADWGHFTRRWAGPAWPLYWASPYLRNGARILRRGAQRRAG